MVRPAKPVKAAKPTKATKAARPAKAVKKARPTSTVELTLATRTSKRSTKKPEPLPETVSSWDDFYRVVRRIPRGRVCTYGAVAAMAGHPRSARHVGYALAALKESKKKGGVPWQRVLGARGRNRAAVTIKDAVGGAVQRMLLEGEGVVFDAKGSVSLDRFGWFEGMPAANNTKKSAAARVLPTRRR
jgi:methylated-DNA-protein-cysteine methyltransferase related protein